VLADAIANKAAELLALGQHEQALASFERAFAILSKEADPWSPGLAAALSGIGRTNLALGRHRAAIEPLTRANGIYDRYPGAGTTAAETQLALARALWDGGGDRQRARRLAESARDTCVKLERSDRAAAATKWLAGHALTERR
jgi:tetratricopeptide (TPR) repeat protein